MIMVQLLLISTISPKDQQFRSKPSLIYFKMVIWRNSVKIAGEQMSLDNFII